MRLQCQICDKIFSQKSSLIRHAKRCTPGPAPSLRQKSCRQCTSSKTKCDLGRPRCYRCELRDTVCEYITPMTRGIRAHLRAGAVPYRDAAVDLGSYPTPPETVHLSNAIPGMDLDIFPHQDSLVNFPWAFEPTMESRGTLTGLTTQADAIAPFENVGCTPEDYSFWQLWNTSPKATAPLARHSMETLLRVMKTWPKALAKGLQTPPMFHFTHTQPQSMLWPIANILPIAQMWASEKCDASETMRGIVVQEMRSLFGQFRSMDERHLLAALQALVMYIIILMFPGRGQVGVSLVDPAIFLSLQRVLAYVAKTGLLLAEERNSIRPSWEGWVHITAKRRAVLCLYILHWSYAVYHDLESFACSQLGFMPAPAAKFLWQAETQHRWEVLYDQWLAQWDKSPFMMSELANIQSGTLLEARAERWLEDADELGVLFFSVVNATDREDPAYEHRDGVPVLTS